MGQQNPVLVCRPRQYRRIVRTPETSVLDADDVQPLGPALQTRDEFSG